MSCRYCTFINTFPLCFILWATNLIFWATDVTSEQRTSPLSYGRHLWATDVTSELRTSPLSYGRHLWATDVTSELRTSPLSYGCHLWATDVTSELRTSPLSNRHSFWAKDNSLIDGRRPVTFGKWSTSSKLTIQRFNFFKLFKSLTFESIYV